jgi:cytochrome c-type biogenesis protein CcmH/NrfG
LAGFWAEVVAFLVVRSHILHGFAHPLSGASDAHMALSWPGAVMFYVWDAFFPVNLAPFYPFEMVQRAGYAQFWWPLLEVLVLVAGVGWAISKAKDWRVYAVCAAWTVIPLAPAMYLKLFLPYEIVHDRYLYMPTIGLSMAVAAMVTLVANRAERRTGVRLWGLTAILLVAVSAAATVGYESWWQNDLTFYRRAVSMTPDYMAAQLDYSVTLMEHRQYEAAIRILDRVLQQEPDDGHANFDRGRAAWETGDSARAEQYFERAAVLAPDVKHWLFLASAKLYVGKAKEGEFAARQALAMDSTEPGAHFALGAALLDEGDRAGGIAELEEELRQHPESAGARKALDRARAQS